MATSKIGMFPGLAVFEPMTPLLHALFLCKEAIPNDCRLLEVEFDSAGEPLATAYPRIVRRRGRDVRLSNKVSAAAGLLLNYASFQYVMLIEMLEKNGVQSADDIKDGFQRSLQGFGLSLGLFTEARNDSIIISR